MSPAAHHLRACLPALAERTSAQLLELFKDTTSDRCELMARCLHEASNVVARLGHEVRIGDQPTV